MNLESVPSVFSTGYRILRGKLLLVGPGWSTKSRSLIMTVTVCMEAEAWFIGHGLPVHHHLRGESWPPAEKRYGLTEVRLSIREPSNVQSEMARFFFFHRLLQNV